MMKRKSLMMNYLFVFIVGILLAIPCQIRSQIIAEIEGLGNDTIFLQYVPMSEIFDSEPYQDTIIAVNNTFTYRFDKADQYMMILEPASLVKRFVQGDKSQDFTRSVLLVVSKDETIKITGKIEPDYIQYAVDGQGFNAEHALHRNTYRKEAINTDAITLQLNYYRFSPDAPSYHDSLIHILQTEKTRLEEYVSGKQMEYIQTHPNSDLSAYYLTHQSLDAFRNYYPSLGENVKTGLLSSLVDKMWRKSEEYRIKEENSNKIQAGVLAPDFTLKDIHGNDFTLSGIKDKYIVLDFWGSWCSWCIAGYPEMKKYYDKYKDRVEFVGIACGDKEESWKKTVEQHQLNWVQLLNQETEIIENDVPVLYAIKGYPTKIILDKDLTIVAVIRGEREEFYEKLDELLN